MCVCVYVRVCRVLPGGNTRPLQIYFGTLEAGCARLFATSRVGCAGYAFDAASQMDAQSVGMCVRVL